MYVEKKKKWPIVLLVLLIFGVLSFFGVRYYLELEAKKKKKQEKPIDESSFLVPLNENQQEYIFTKISFYDGMLPYNSFSSSTLEVSKAFQFVESIKDKEYVDFTRGVNVDALNTILKRYFGPDISLDPNLSTCEDASICHFYDKKTKRYIKTTPTASSNVKSRNFFVEGTKHKKTKAILIKVKQLYYLPNLEEEVPVRFFQSPELALQNQNPIIDLKMLHGSDAYDLTQYSTYLKEAYQQVEASLPIITYTFQYQDGVYYLESVVK